MKKLHVLLALTLLAGISIAQAPQEISYQAVIRNANNELVTNANIGMQISILFGADDGQVVYVERHFPASNDNGLVTVSIGSGTAVTGSFQNINWSEGVHFIKTETDLNGGANYTIFGVSQVHSVPYAIHAQTAETVIGSSSSIVPRVARKGQTLSVSFSGGDDITFSQSSTTCPDLYANVVLHFTQGSPTTIYPRDVYYIDSKRFDAVFDIPSFIPSGLYDIILGAGSSCPHVIDSSFKIDN